MLKDRSELERILIKYIANTVTHPAAISDHQQWYLNIFEKYNIPINLSSDIISQRKDLSEFNEFILFAITDIIKPDLISKYFTDVQIKMYTGQKYQQEKFDFPIKFHLIKITDEQYIGKTTAQFLMKLRSNQLINYNADTQRALRIILQGGTKILRPYINDRAVDEIDNSFSEQIFIPNMLTLNINPDDENAEYEYNEKTETLTVYNITSFDIVDGYHRYLGLSRNYDRDNNWDYPMMLQVSAFSTGRAKQLIFQEDHKTKMKEVDSASYNQYDAGNMVVNRLNTDTDCNLNNKLSVNDNLISPGLLGRVINKLYFRKKPERKEIINVTKNIKQKLNLFTEEHDEYLDNKWMGHEIMIVIYGIFKGYTTDQIYAALQNISKDDKATLNSIRDINNRVLNILKEVY